METETSGPKCKCFPHHNKIFMGFSMANHCRVGLWEVIFQAPNFPGSDTIEAWNIEFGASSREGASARMMQKLPVWDSNFSEIAVNVSRPRGSQRGNTICFSRFTQSSFLCFYAHLFVDDSAGLHEFCLIPCVFPQNLVAMATWRWSPGEEEMPEEPDDRGAAAPLQPLRFSFTWDGIKMRSRWVNGKWMKIM